ncbi:YbaY family lipoprotein [Chryseobacterium sp. WG14]|uniref:YbaY family lipoprotein n=1 Tax=Chryseobacterium sp. WG14 TaxID=2926909 RepID=UPI00211EE42E|nr:YbaY family lipoprotein [Chryseobacterium sp. WG14]MCQ9639147.1 YbaY family lipoprotein [Chryseobacterium sp. WG14]
MRKNLTLLMTAGVLSVTLFSCNKRDKKLLSENTEAKSEESNPSDNQENLKLEFTGTDNFTIKNPKLKVSLYGHDPLLADAPATLITEKEYEQTSVPFTIDLPVPKDAASRIDPKAAGSMKYYVSIEWDSDGNGKAGEKRDIYIDHDKEFPNVKLNGELQKVYLKILK